MECSKVAFSVSVGISGCLWVSQHGCFLLLVLIGCVRFHFDHCMHCIDSTVVRHECVHWEGKEEIDEYVSRCLQYLQLHHVELVGLSLSLLSAKNIVPIHHHRHSLHIVWSHHSERRLPYIPRDDRERNESDLYIVGHHETKVVWMLFEYFGDFIFMLSRSVLWICCIDEWWWLGATILSHFICHHPVWLRLHDAVAVAPIIIAVSSSTYNGSPTFCSFALFENWNHSLYDLRDHSNLGHC